MIFALRASAMLKWIRTPFIGPDMWSSSIPKYLLGLLKYTIWSSGLCIMRPREVNPCEERPRTTRNCPRLIVLLGTVFFLDAARTDRYVGFLASNTQRYVSMKVIRCLGSNSRSDFSCINTIEG